MNFPGFAIFFSSRETALKACLLFSIVFLLFFFFFFAPIKRLCLAFPLSGSERAKLSEILYALHRVRD